MSTFVLVHGCFYGGWCWDKVAPQLRAAGHDVYAPTLSGIADRSHLLSEKINLHTHIDDVANLIQWHDLSNVILVGHSYGGMVISGVAEAIPNKIKSLVYLDAFVPEDGESALDALTKERQDKFYDNVRVDEDWKVAPVSSDYFGITDPDMLQWADSKITDQPLATMTDKIHLSEKYHSIVKHHYLYAETNTSIYQGIAERLQDQPRWKINSLSCGHLMMLLMPDELSQYLVGFA